MSTHSLLKQCISSHFGIPEVYNDEIAKLFFYEKLKKGEFYVKDGKECNKICFVVSGHLRVWKDIDGKEVTHFIGYKGLFVTDFSSLTIGQDSRFNIQAISDTEVFTLTKENFESIKNPVPEWQSLQRIFIAKCFSSLEKRLLSLLTKNAKQRYNQFFDQHKELFNEVPLNYIASMLNMSPETLSRIRNEKS